jgi:hypothetical protein
VPYEHDVVEIFVSKYGDDVAHVDVQTDFRPKEMTSLAQSGQRGSDYDVSLFAQQRRDLLPEPRAMPRGVYENEGYRPQTGRVSQGCDLRMSRKLYQYHC